MMLTRVELRVFDSAKGWVHIRLLEGRWSYVAAYCCYERIWRGRGCSDSCAMQHRPSKVAEKMMLNRVCWAPEHDQHWCHGPIVRG
eukprot:345073-Rhodomonas_salina.3